MDSLKSLHNRLRGDSIAHLGRKSVHLIGPYEIGYELAQERWGAPLLQSNVSGRAMQEWAEHKYHWTCEMGCRQNLASFALLMSVDEQSAFDLYFDLRDAAVSELQVVADIEADIPRFSKQELVDFIQSDCFRNRPALFFGRRSLDALWSLCSGFVWAEKDLGIYASTAQTFTSQFQSWIEARYPFAQSRAWNKTLDFLALYSPERAWSTFYDAFDMFQAGKSPDSLSKTGERMLEGITRHILAAHPNANPDGVAAAFRDTAKNICPS